MSLAWRAGHEQVDRANFTGQVGVENLWLVSEARSGSLAAYVPVHQARHVGVQHMLGAEVGMMHRQSVNIDIDGRYRLQSSSRRDRCLRGPQRQAATAAKGVHRPDGGVRSAMVTDVHGAASQEALPPSRRGGRPGIGKIVDNRGPDLRPHLQPADDLLLLDRKLLASFLRHHPAATTAASASITARHSSSGRISRKRLDLIRRNRLTRSRIAIVLRCGSERSACGYWNRNNPLAKSRALA